MRGAGAADAAIVSIRSRAACRDVPTNPDRERGIRLAPPRDCVRFWRAGVPC